MAKVSNKGSKNSIENRGKKLTYEYNGQDVSPVKYYGVFIGFGVFMAMKYTKSGQIALDQNGTVIPWSGNAKKKA